MRNYYPEDYSPYLETAVSRTGIWRTLSRRLADPLDVAIPAVRAGTMLEIGTASGNYAVEMRRRGWQVEGVEFDPASARRAAARLDSPVHCGDILDMAFDEGAFDLICAWMTIEHLRDPVLALRRCRDWLRPGGWLAFSVPDAGSWQFRVFRSHWFATQLPTHLYHFTSPVLFDLLRQCGYAEISIRWQRTLIDIPLSLANLVETRFGRGAGAWSQRLANSPLSRALARGLGMLASPLRLTGRITVWARKAPGDAA